MVSSSSGLDVWALRVSAALRALPPVAANRVRLYRIEPRTPAPLAPWLAQALIASGAQAAQGRWFTDDEQALAFYALDQADVGPCLVTVDLPADRAAAQRVENLPSLGALRPRAFSRDRAREFFLDDATLAGRQRWSLSAPAPRRGARLGG